MKTEEILRKVGIVPVIKMDTPEHAVPLAIALKNGGLWAAEITFRSEAAVDSIRNIAKEESELFICAGTVLSAEQAQEAVDAGAKAIISPGCSMDTIRWCKSHNIPIIPGCATPTEVELCMRAGQPHTKIYSRGCLYSSPIFAQSSSFL